MDCNVKDSFSFNYNNTLKYPIDLITIDEAIYAGIPLDSLSLQSHLTNITTIDKDVSHEVATKTAKVKPMIALNNNVTIKNGDDSFENHTLFNNK